VRLLPPLQPSGAGTFAFGRLAQTRMLCPEPTLEPALTTKLPWVRSYRPVPLRDLESESSPPRR
jgi:hypothetical protein